MRRGLTVVLLAALFAGAGLAGFLAATRLGPEHLAATLERGLSELLDTDVELQGVGVRLEPGWLALALDLEKVTAWPSPQGHGLEVHAVHGRLDPIAWLTRGELLQSVVLEEAQLDLAAFRREPRPTTAPEPDPLVEHVSDLEGLGGWLLEYLCPLPPLDVQGGRIRGPDGGPEPLLQDVQGSLRCERGRPRLGLKGRSPGGGRLDLRLDQDARSSFDVELALADVELTPFAWLTRPLALAGRVTGRLAWTHRTRAPQMLTLALKGPSVRAVVPRDRAPAWEVQLPASAVRIELAATRADVTLGFAEWQDQGLRVRAEGGLELPVRDASQLRLALATDRLDLGEARRRVDQLPAAVREPLLLVLERLETGRLEQVVVETQTTVSDWNELLAGRILGRSGATRLEFDVADASVLVGATERMVGVSGHMAFRGDEVEVRGLRASYRNEPLPRIDAIVSGLSHIHSSDELNCITPRSVPGLPGIEEVQRWIRSRREEPGEATWQRLAVEAEWLAHPALLCTLEDVIAELRPEPGGLAIELSRGVWASMPVQAHAEFREGADGDWRKGSLSLQASVRPAFEPMRLDPPARQWARGRFQLDATRAGNWKLRGAAGRFRAVGSRVELFEGEVRLRPEGVVQAHLAVDLGSGQDVTYQAGLQLAGIPIEQLWASGVDGESPLNGALHGAAEVEGTLLEGRPPLARAKGHFTANARDGLLHKRLPILLAVTVASDRWDPFGDRDRVHYDAIDLAGRIDGGQFEFETVRVEAPTFRMGASGRLGVASPHDLQGVLGIFFFPTLDRLIDRVPLVGRVLLGSNRNLVGMYFALQGEVAEPKARIIPVKSLTAVGPASFVLEELPDFVWGGIQRIQSVLLPRAGAAKKEGRTDS